MAAELVLVARAPCMLTAVATRSCVVPVSLIGDRPIATIEAYRADPVGRAVQDAWVEKDVVQCGYCQSGQIMSAVALLKATPKPTDQNIEESMGGNLCRCATYVRIREAIKSASQQIDESVRAAGGTGAVWNNAESVGIPAQGCACNPGITSVIDEELRRGLGIATGVATPSGLRRISCEFYPGFQSKPWAEISERFQR